MALLQCDNLMWPGVFSAEKISADAGEKVQVAGPSGAGKTLMLRALAMLEPRIDGCWYLRGTAPTDAPSFRRRVILVPQQPANPDHSLQVHMAEPFALQVRADQEYSEEVARGLCSALGLNDMDWQAPMRSFSLGQRQRIALARALSCAPDVLLLDEPSSALDPANRELMMALVDDWHSPERLLIWTSHEELWHPTQVWQMSGGKLESA